MYAGATISDGMLCLYAVASQAVQQDVSKTGKLYISGAGSKQGKTKNCFLRVQMDQISRTEVENAFLRLSERIGEKTVDKLVLAVGKETLQQRTDREQLLRLCRQLVQIEAVEQVSLTAAETVLFCRDWQRENGRGYSGYLLLFRLSEHGAQAELLKIKEQKNLIFREESVKIEVPLAGLESKFYSRTAAEALSTSPERLTAGRQAELVNAARRTINANRMAINQIFDEYGTGCPEDLEIELKDQNWREKHAPLTCRHILTAYEAVIQPKLAQLLKSVERELREKNVPWSSRRQSQFRLAFEGGLSNCWLVQKQVADFFRLSTMDARLSRINRQGLLEIHSGAMGASMLAAGRMEMGMLSPCDVTILSQDEEGKQVRDTVVKRHQLLAWGRINYPLWPGDGQPVTYLINPGEAIRVELDWKGGQKKREYALQLTQLGSWTARLGLSLNEQGKWSLHGVRCDPDTGSCQGEEGIVPL